jgi:hypothetical protein
MLSDCVLIQGEKPSVSSQENVASSCGACNCQLAKLIRRRVLVIFRIMQAAHLLQCQIPAVKNPFGTMLY